MSKQEQENSLSYKERLCRSLVINLSIFSMGVCEAVKGPTLLDLTEILSSSITKVSLFFFTFSIGSLLGVILAGVCLDRLSKHRYPLLGMAGIGFGITTICIPFTGHVYVLYVNSFISGLFSGTLDAGCNVENLAVWRFHPHKGSWILSFSFSYAVGSFVAPLIARPFIGGAKMTKIWILYPLVGSIEIGIVLTFFLLYTYDMNKSQDDSPAKIETPERDKGITSEDNQKSPEPSGIYYYCFFLLTWVFFFIQMGVVTGYGNYIATYAVTGPLGLSKHEGADMTARYWAMFTLVRFFSIFGARLIPPQVFLLVSLAACVTGSGFGYAYSTSYPALSASSLIFGFGTSTLYASGLLWIEREGISISYKRGSFIFSGSAFGADAYPIVIGQFIERNPGILPEIAFISSIIMSTFFILMMFFIKKSMGKKLFPSLN